MLSQLAGDALNDIDAAIDFKMRELCQGNKEHSKVDEMRCLTITPPYIGSLDRIGGGARSVERAISDKDQLRK
jgi:hypothetical protein